jgi:hypothetical protein
VLSRAAVRSTNWSQITKVPGSSSGFSDPQAEGPTMRSTPTSFIAQMFAL